MRLMRKSEPKQQDCSKNLINELNHKLKEPKTTYPSAPWRESLDSITEESLVSSVVDAFSKGTSCPPPPAASFLEGSWKYFFI